MNHSAWKFSLLLPLLTVMNAGASASDQSTAPVPLTWDRVCEAAICHRAGHDGVVQAQVSADGAHAVLSVITPGRTGIHQLALPEGNSHFWTEGHSPAWFADGRRIVFVHNADLWTIGLYDPAPQRITTDAHDVAKPVPSPDGRMIAFSSRRSGHQDLWLVPADGSAPPRALTDQAMVAGELRFGHAWSPDGKKLVFVSNQANYWHDDLWLADVESGRSHQLSNGFLALGTPSWSPDGRSIAAFGTPKPGFWYTHMADLYLVDAETGAERRLDSSVQVVEIGQPVWGKDGQELFVTVHTRGALDVWRVPTADGAATRVTHEGGMIDGLAADPGGERLLLVRSTPQRGREVDALDPRGGPLHRLTSLSSNWQGLQQPREISYRTRDGLYIQAFLFLPPDFDPSRTYPALVQLHSGGTHSFYNGLNLVEQRMAQQGFVVLAVNYRGGSGFGRDFQDLSIGNWAHRQALDAADAAAWIRRQPWSSGQVGAYGYSYGGIVAIAAEIHDPGSFDAVASMSGIYDFAQAHDEADRLGRMFLRYGHGGSPEEVPQRYAASNLLERLERIQAPALLTHGEQDRRAPYAQFRSAVETLERHDKVFKAISYPGEGHLFRDPHNRGDIYRQMENWMRRWLIEGES
ncbi:MAG: prolyl oligopeptidase family serine peptidase [Xanthomonadaceae bacterium]|nr:prolyl oligopeptidase family serine peptidase [Xanthomonadaceae bacterium]